MKLFNQVQLKSALENEIESVQALIADLEKHKSRILGRDVRLSGEIVQIHCAVELSLFEESKFSYSQLKVMSQKPIMQIEEELKKNEQHLIEIEKLLLENQQKLKNLLEKQMQELAKAEKPEQVISDIEMANSIFGQQCKQAMRR